MADGCGAEDALRRLRCGYCMLECFRGRRLVCAWRPERGRLAAAAQGEWTLSETYGAAFETFARSCCSETGISFVSGRIAADAADDTAAGELVRLAQSGKEGVFDIGPGPSA